MKNIKSERERETREERQLYLAKLMKEANYVYEYVLTYVYFNQTSSGITFDVHLNFNKILTLHFTFYLRIVLLIVYFECTEYSECSNKGLCASMFQDTYKSVR